MKEGYRWAIMESEIRRNFARKMARKLLADCGIIHVPISLEIILEYLKIKSLEADNLPESYDAYIVNFDNEWYALLKKGQHVHRQRFSLAHEIGHLQLKHDISWHTAGTIDEPPARRTYYDYEKGLEIEANVFAGELLVPYDLLKKEYKKTANLEVLSQIFKVSREVMTIQFMQYERHLLK